MNKQDQSIKPCNYQKCDGNHAAPACLDPQCWHKGAPDRCPTCGGTNKSLPYLTAACPDEWHNTPSDSATPAPEPWKPKFKVGDPVILKFDPKRPKCRIVVESTGPGDQAGIQWGNKDEWWNTSSVHESEMEPAPWTMPAPPAGHEWRMKYPWPTSRDQVHLAR